MCKIVLLMLLLVHLWPGYVVLEQPAASDPESLNSNTCAKGLRLGPVSALLKLY